MSRSERVCLASFRRGCLIQRCAPAWLWGRPKLPLRHCGFWLKSLLFGEAIAPAIQHRASQTLETSLMKQSTRVAKRQLALWIDRNDRFQPSEEMRQELTIVLADLLLQALGARSPADQHGDADEPEDHT